MPYAMECHMPWNAICHGMPWNAMERHKAYGIRHMPWNAIYHGKPYTMESHGMSYAMECHGFPVSGATLANARVAP